MRVRSGSRVTHESDQLQVFGSTHCLTQFHGRFTWRNAMGGSDLHTHQPRPLLSRPRRRRLLATNWPPADCRPQSRKWFAPGQRDRAINVVLASWLACQQDTGHSGARHQLTFRHSCTRNTDRSKRKLPFGDVRALVNLDVATQLDAGVPAVIRHRLQVLLE